MSYSKGQENWRWLIGWRGVDALWEGINGQQVRRSRRKKVFGEEEQRRTNKQNTDLRGDKTTNKIFKKKKRGININVEEERNKKE